MTRTHTAADFENAQFAKHPDGQLAHRKVAWPDGNIRQWTTTGDNSTGQSSDARMAFDGWVPVIPARTIHDRDVEALCVDKASYERDDYLDGFIRGFQKAGGVILDDPEPTNTDRLEELIISAPGNFEGVKAILKRPASVRAWAEYLNDHGVTAPNVKDNND